MKIDSGEGEEEDGKRKEWWQREKITFNGRIDAFTSRSHQFLGTFLLTTIALHLLIENCLRHFLLWK
jgi:hypothetical protein